MEQTKFSLQKTSTRVTNLCQTKVASFAIKLVRAVESRGDISVGWVIAALATFAVTVATVVGNGMVMVALKRAKRAPAHYPLASLVTADLLLGLTVLPIAAARELFAFHLSWALCACWSTLDVLCCTASILSICVLGWERWCGITAPLARVKRLRCAKMTSALVWPVSTVIALPTAFIPSPKHFHPGEVPKACTVNTNVGYVFSSVTFSFYIPASIMVLLYYRILRSLAVPPTIRAHRGRSPKRNAAPPKEIKKSDAIQVKSEIAPKNILIDTPNKNKLDPACDAVSALPSPLKPSNNSPGGIIPRQRRATRTIVMLMSLFLICWTPFFVMLPIDSLCSCVWDTPWLWCTWLGYANSALNPMVYAVGSPSVRRALRSSFSLTTSSACFSDVPMTPCVRGA